MKKRTCAVILLTGLLSACALEPRQVQPPETRNVVPPMPLSKADQLLDQVARLHKFEADEFTAERDSMRNQFQRDKSDFNRVKYALALVVEPVGRSPSPVSVAQDDVELINLIDPLISGPGVVSTQADLGVRALATLLHDMVSDRRKVREQLRDTQARLALAKRDDTRDAETRALRARVEELETKLNALKSIDRSVTRRAEPVRK